MANTNVKSGVVFGNVGASSGFRHGEGASSIASAITFDTFNESFASFKDLNKSTFIMRGANLEDSFYDEHDASALVKNRKDAHGKGEGEKQFLKSGRSGK